LKTLHAAAKGKPIDELTDESGKVWLERGREEWWHDKSSQEVRYIPRLTIQDCRNNKYFIHSLSRYRNGEEQLLLRGPFLRGPYLRGREVGPVSNMSLVIEWLQKCRDFHGSTCRVEKLGTKSPQGHFRLIDVEERRVIPAFGRNFRYVA
jgi:hypothetical protein